jgi:hypothetical protein
VAAAAASTFALPKGANDILCTFSALSSILVRTRFTFPCDFSENGCDERHTLVGWGVNGILPDFIHFTSDLDKIQ